MFYPSNESPLCSCHTLIGYQNCPVHNMVNTQQPINIQNHYFYSNPKGWECVKCSRVYSPTHFQCDSCNSKIKD